MPVFDAMRLSGARLRGAPGRRGAHGTGAPPSDEALLALYAEGDEMAARLLAERLMPRVLNVATRMLHDPAEAEDVVQEAMLRLWRQARQWRAGEAQVGTWLYRVVSNLCIDRLRKARGVGLEAIDEPADERPGVEARLLEQARRDALQQALQVLPLRQRQAVVLRHIEGLGNPQIAQIMDISVEAVESLTARGKRALAAALRERQEELGIEDV